MYLAAALILLFLFLVAIGFYLWPQNGYRSAYIASQIEKCESNSTKAQQCLTKVVVDEAKSHGVDAGFDALASAYARDKTFADTCHGATHTLGDIGYEQYKKNEQFKLTSKTSYCGFGFFHGFMESLLFDTRDISVARRFCDSAEESMKKTFSGVSFACYHGIGHGVVDGSDPALWGDAKKYIEPGLKLCDTLGDNEEHKTRCASGVFNALGVAYMEPRYLLKPKPNDPYAICREQDKPYARKACYDQMNSYIVPSVGTFKKAISLAAEAELRYRRTAIWSVAGMSAQKTLSENRDAGVDIATCLDLSSEFRDACVDGFAAGLVEFGLPGKEFEIPVAACSHAGQLAQTCYQEVTASALDRVPIASRTRVCTNIRSVGGDAAGDACLVTINRSRTP